MRRHILTLIGPFLVMGAAVLAGAGAGGQEAPTSPRPSYQEMRTPLPPSHPHLPELAGFLERLEIHKPQIHGELGIFALTRRKGAALRGRWSTMDEAIESRFLVVTEQKSGATGPVIYMENRSPDRHVFVMGGGSGVGGQADSDHSQGHRPGTGSETRHRRVLCGGRPVARQRKI